ncbi:MAG: SPOR domain-containing protein [Deltaproteobacteria bacterium]|nr:SPOR domain-containing protein [Deltaproteobacteria bacterium]
MTEFSKDLEDYFCKFTFGQFVTLILIELVTLFFVFYLGARYGPDLIGGNREIAKTSQEKQLSASGENSEKKVDYTFPRELLDDAKKERGAVRVKPSGMTAQEYENKIREMTDERTVPIIVPAPEKPEKVEPIVMPTPERPRVIEPAKQEEVGQFSIQVGSYRAADEAMKAVAQWKGKGYSSFMMVAEVPKKGTWYRVRIGRFVTKEEAQGFLQKFKGKEKTDALIVSSRI